MNDKNFSNNFDASSFPLNDSSIVRNKDVNRYVHENVLNNTHKIFIVSPMKCPYLNHPMEVMNNWERGGAADKFFSLKKIASEDFYDSISIF